MEPLASQIRPKKLSEFVGQLHLVGEGKPLRIAIENKHLFSFILWGPPDKLKDRTYLERPHKIETKVPHEKSA